MIVTYADIDGFKNLKGISFAPDPKYNIIVGPNAQGKTNLLEAMWILSGCRSFRGSKEKDYICLGGERMQSKIKILDSVREQKISFEMTRSASNPKIIHLNGVKQKGTRTLFDVFKCIAFIPDDVEPELAPTIMHNPRMMMAAGGHPATSSLNSPVDVMNDTTWKMLLRKACSIE